MVKNDVESETLLLEKKRLTSLVEYGLLDTEAAQELDILTKFTAKLFKAPIGIITLIDKNRQWFKSKIGIELSEIPRDVSFCDYTIRSNEVFEVQDTLLDDRFKNNPFVTGDPYVRYYAGAPLRNEEGYRLGSLAIIDKIPRKINEEEKEILKLLARQVVNYFELHSRKKKLEKEVEKRTRELKSKISELEHKENELILSNKDLDNFIYTASHDLKAPISNIEGLISFLQGIHSEHCTEHEDISKSIDMMRKSIQRFRNTIQDLTEITSIQKIMDSYFQTNNIEEILTDVTESIRDLITVSEAVITTDFSSAPEIRFPRKDLRSIIYNLISNAIKYKKPEQKPEIFLCSYPQDQYIVLSVKDNGLGIPQQNLGKIFQMFQRLHNHVEGTGVGLYLVSKMVNNAGGKIEVKSKPGEGSEFRVYFKQ
jgi:signal transduction histidine kinase